MPRGRKKAQVFEKSVNTSDGKQKDLKLTFDELMEALNPKLTKDALLIPGFNCRLEFAEGGTYVPVFIKGKPELKFYHLTPHYEQQLVELLAPIIDEFKNFLGEVGAEGDDFNWNVTLAQVVPALIQRLIASLEDYNITLAVAAKIISESSIVLNRRYAAQDLTEEDQENIKKLDSSYFLENVPSDYILRHIVLPQYRKTAMADAMSLFFSTIRDYLSVGVANLIQKQTSLTTAGT